MAGEAAGRAWFSVLAILAGAGVGGLGALLDVGLCGAGGVGYLLAAAALGWTRLPSAPLAAFVILPAHGMVHAATHELRSTAGIGMCVGFVAAAGLALVALATAFASHVTARTRTPRRRPGP